MSRRTLTIDDTLHRYLVDVGTRDDDLLRRLREENAALADQGVDVEMQAAPELGAFLTFFARTLGVRRAIEVGVFTGYSALCTARGLADGGTLVAIEASDDHARMCRRFWKEAGVADRIDLRLGDGLDQLDRMLASGEAGNYDWCFHDADKPRALDYAERFYRLLRPGGVMLFDNALRGGHITDDPAPGEGTAAFQELNRQLRDDARLDWCLLPVADGLAMARKRE
jgi:predicted O-methyltransferase YrrM